MTEVKNCPKCGVYREVTFFGRDRSRPSGLACWCKNCLNSHRRKWHHENKQKSLEGMKAYRAKNPPDPAQRQAAVERAVKWNHENYELHRAYVKSAKHRRRAQMKGGLTGPELSAWVRGQAKRCRWCGAECSNDFHVDHVKPLARGGEHIAENLAIACPTCNRRKHAKDPSEFAQILAGEAQ